MISNIKNIVVVIVVVVVVVVGVVVVIVVVVVAVIVVVVVVAVGVVGSSVYKNTRSTNPLDLTKNKLTSALYIRTPYIVENRDSPQILCI